LFTCLGGLRYWPLTGSVGFFRAPLEVVAAKAAPWNRPGKTVRYGSLDEALVAQARYKFGLHQAAFALSAGAGGWTVVFESAFPGSDIRGFMRARAQYDLGCEFVAVEWVPNNSRTLPSAAFQHYRPARRRLPFGRPERDERTVQASDQDGRWEFDAVGEPREFEEPERYQARRKADRLDPPLLERYVAAVGVPVADPAWLDGPVEVAVFGPAPDTDVTWSTVEELRTLCGYPVDRIPTDLVRL
jgi:hypothetical protein